MDIVIITTVVQSVQRMLPHMREVDADAMLSWRSGAFHAKRRLQQSANDAITFYDFNLFERPH